jgi:cysteine desulfurase
VLALGLPYEASHGSIRFSLGKRTTKEDIDYVLEKVPEIVARLRSMSPIHLTKSEVLNG